MCRSNSLDAMSARAAFSPASAYRVLLSTSCASTTAARVSTAFRCSTFFAWLRLASRSRCRACLTELSSVASAAASLFNRVNSSCLSKNASWGCYSSVCSPWTWSSCRSSYSRNRSTTIPSWFPETVLERRRGHLEQFTGTSSRDELYKFVVLMPRPLHRSLLYSGRSQGCPGVSTIAATPRSSGRYSSIGTPCAAMLPEARCSASHTEVR